MLLIDDEPEKSSTPTKKMRMANLDGFVAILRISDFEIYFAKNIGKTDVFLNGMIMIKNHVYILSLGSTIKSQNNRDRSDGLGLVTRGFNAGKPTQVRGK